MMCLIERVKKWIISLALTTDEKKTIVLVIVGSLVLGGVLLVTDNLPLGDALLRNTYGAGMREEELLVSVEGVLAQEDITLRLSERMYSQDQIEGAIDGAWEKLIEGITTSHGSLEQVSGELDLPESIEGYPFTVIWDWSPRDILNSKGEIQEDYIEDDGSVLLLTATLCYGSWEYIFQQGVRVQPVALTDEEVVRAELYEYMELADISNGEQESLTLPKVIGEHMIRWSKRKDYRGLMVIGLGFLIGVLLLFKKKQDRQELERVKLEEMELDYPQVIGAFLLYMGAGMTSKNAWHSIVKEYQIKEKHRHIYEMMKDTYQEMCNGRSEIEAYEAFGLTTGLMVYQKFSLLLAQNVKKGTKGLIDILEREVRDAFEMKKRKAKSLGEAAGTKLLLPMFLMLAVVLCIVIVPAFLSVQL